eukprot:3705235-Rhodomonas_salina.1
MARNQDRVRHGATLLALRLRLGGGSDEYMHASQCIMMQPERERERGDWAARHTGSTSWSHVPRGSVSLAR